MKKLLFAVLFIAVVSERLFFDLGPNVELISASVVIISYYLGSSWAAIFALTSLVVTDRILGNTNIFLFTWSGFLIPALFVKLKKQDSIIKRIPNLALTGLGFNLFFFFWTNFGVWYLDSWGMYPKTLTGLINCYINGLPFLKNDVISTLIAIISGVLVINLAERLSGAINKSSISRFWVHEAE
jgi:hypothetical protein